MTPRKLTREDLRAALAMLKGYTAVRVFADDVDWAAGVDDVERADPGDVVATPGHPLTLAIEADTGVVQARLALGNKVADSPSEGSVRDEAVRRARAQKGDGWRSDLLFGILVSEGADDAVGASRIFTLRFDPSDGRWRVYDGDLQRWMKNALLPQHVIAKTA